MSLDNETYTAASMKSVAERLYGNCFSGLVRYMMECIENLSKRTRLDDIYPVGAIYISTDSTNPGTLFGGTWQRIYRKFLVAAASSPEDVFAPGATGGDEYYTLTSSNLPKHRHAIGDNANVMTDGISGSSSQAYILGSYTYDSSVTPHNSYTDYAGNASPDPIETVPPYLAVYMWKRTA